MNKHKLLHTTAVGILLTTPMMQSASVFADSSTEVSVGQLVNSQTKHIAYTVKFGAGWDFSNNMDSSNIRVIDSKGQEHSLSDAELFEEDADAILDNASGITVINLPDDAYFTQSSDADNGLELVSEWTTYNGKAALKLKFVRLSGKTTENINGTVYLANRVTRQVNYHVIDDTMGTVSTQKDTLYANSLSSSNYGTATAKTGYQFEGWYRNADGTGLITTNSTPLHDANVFQQALNAKNTDMYAKFSQIQAPVSQPWYVYFHDSTNDKGAPQYTGDYSSGRVPTHPGTSYKRKLEDGRKLLGFRLVVDNADDLYDYDKLLFSENFNSDGERTYLSDNNGNNPLGQNSNVYTTLVTGAENSGVDLGLELRDQNFIIKSINVYPIYEKASKMTVTYIDHNENLVATGSLNDEFPPGAAYARHNSDKELIGYHFKLLRTERGTPEDYDFYQENFKDNRIIDKDGNDVFSGTTFTTDLSENNNPNEIVRTQFGVSDRDQFKFHELVISPIYSVPVKQGTINTSFIVRNADGTFVNVPQDGGRYQSSQEPVTVKDEAGETYTLDAQNQPLDFKEATTKVNAIGKIGLPNGNTQPTLKGHKAFRFVGIYKGSQPNTNPDNLIASEDGKATVKFEGEVTNNYYYVYEPVITVKYVEGTKLNFSNPGASEMQANSPLIGEHSYDIVGTVGEDYTAEVKEIAHYTQNKGALKGNALGMTTIWDNNDDTSGPLGYNSWMHKNGLQIIPATWSATQTAKFGDIAEIRWAYSPISSNVTVKYVDMEGNELYRSNKPSGHEGDAGTVEPSSSAAKEMEKQGYKLVGSKVDDGEYQRENPGKVSITWGTSQTVTFQYLKNTFAPNEHTITTHHGQLNDNGEFEAFDEAIAKGETVAGVATTEKTIEAHSIPGYKLVAIQLDGQPIRQLRTTDLQQSNVKATFGTHKDVHFIYAKASYPITYELDGGTNAESNPIEYTYGTGVERFATPTKADHTFLGWTTEDGSPIDSISNESTGAKTLYANWKYTPTPSLKPNDNWTNKTPITPEVEPIETSEGEDWTNKTPITPEVTPLDDSEEIENPETENPETEKPTTSDQPDVSETPETPEVPTTPEAPKASDAPKAAPKPVKKGAPVTQVVKRHKQTRLPNTGEKETVLTSLIGLSLATLALVMMVLKNKKKA